MQIILSFVKIAYKKIKDTKETKEIINFLKDSGLKTKYKFRTNHAISSHINFTEERVRELCSKSKNIKRNTNAKESWRLV